MHSILDYPCSECGGIVLSIAKLGRHGFYLGERYMIPSTFRIPTCEGCGAEWIDDEMAAALDLEFLRQRKVAKNLTFAFKDSQEFHAEASKLLEMVERQERGKITENELLAEWKRFMRAGTEYLKKLGNQSPLN